MIGRWGAAITMGLASFLIIDLTSRAIFVAGGSDAATVVWGPAFAAWLVMAVIATLIVMVAVSRRLPFTLLIVLWLAVLTIATHRATFDPATGDVQDQWLGITLRSQTFADEVMTGFQRCEVFGLSGICAKGNGTTFRTITLFPAVPLAVSSDGRLITSRYTKVRGG